MCIAFVFRRLPRRAYGTARNDDFCFRQPESKIKALSQHKLFYSRTTSKYKK
ncbi:MAG: hypothetical protein IJV35_03605 [Neisseriaceae bacterium]|nr:hypothetical protein [Neisseriaceae bacterium]